MLDGVRVTPAKQLDAFLEAISGTALLVDTDTNVLACNAALLAAVQRSRAEVIGHSVLQFFPPELAAARRSRFDTCMATRSPVRWEDHRAGKDFLNTVTPVFEADGSLAGAAIYSFDITDIKRLEKERESLAAQLQHALKMEAIGRLAGGIAHDFNNILMAMTALASGAIRALEGNPSVRDDLHEINRLSDHAAGLIRQLMSFGRRQSANPVVVEIDGEIRQCAGLLQRTLRNDIAVRCECGPGAKRAVVDPNQLSQILPPRKQWTRDTSSSSTTTPRSCDRSAHI